MGRELGVPGAFWGITSGKNGTTMDDQNVVYLMKVINLDTARKLRGIREPQPMDRLEMLHPNGQEMVSDANIWIGLDLFAEYIDADNKRKENARAEAKAGEDAMKSSSFESALWCSAWS